MCVCMCVLCMCVYACVCVLRLQVCLCGVSPTVFQREMKTKRLHFVLDDSWRHTTQTNLQTQNTNTPGCQTLFQRDLKDDGRNSASTCGANLANSGEASRKLAAQLKGRKQFQASPRQWLRIRALRASGCGPPRQWLRPELRIA